MQGGHCCRPEPTEEKGVDRDVHTNANQYLHRANTRFQKKGVPMYVDLGGAHDPPTCLRATLGKPARKCKSNSLADRIKKL
jgi:hypothetical protein